jgi:DNA polymerase-3 subunit delta'
MAEATEKTLAVHYPWQANTWQHFAQLRQADRLPHALLLSGVPGIGKLRFAQALGQALLCEQTQSDVACGRCGQCQLNIAGTHPDLKLLQPEDGARQVKIDQVRSVVGFLSQTSQQGGYKIAIVAPAEAMNANAANALLKSLEEPAGKTLLILVTDRPSSLLATIRSRCQVVAMAAPREDQARSWLEPLVASDEQAKVLLQACGGQPLTALALHESGDLEEWQQREQHLQQLFLKQLTPIKLAEQWQQLDLDNLLLWLQSQLANLIKAKMSGNVSAGWQAALVSLPVRELYRLLDRVSQSLSQLQRGHNPNKQLLLEDLLLDLSAITQLKTA